ncbi:hypothetical protein DID88_009462 [Monilinia fructigena]|uniref:Uncharacterized protein n=1 Tax=Monilinia fructigena TaxID=38457 RepID=A0A395IMH9_9HELO|nr:hypothetical protein DID88_009462 [Monilinia fructigena]
MPVSYPSIQSFFQKEVHPTSSSLFKGKETSHAILNSGSLSIGGEGFLRDEDGMGSRIGDGDGDGDGDGMADGFTEEELSGAMDPLMKKWNPRRESQGSYICGESGKILLRLLVKLYFVNQSYPLKLGHLLSIWTAFISDASKADGASTTGILVSANLFPGRNTSDHVMIHTHSGASDICRIPLGYTKGEPLAGLMTIEAYLNGGHDGVIGVKLLICVRVLERERKLLRKMEENRFLFDVILFDHTGEVKMKCWGDLIESVKEWQPGRTILLLSNPLHKLDYGGKGILNFGRHTMVDVEPDFPDAQWLKRWAGGLMRKDSVGVVFPDDIWGEEEVEEAIYGSRTCAF